MKRKTVTTAVTLLTLLLSSSTPCHAIGTAISVLSNICRLRSYNLEAGIYGGYLNLKTEELVLGSNDSGESYDISKLNWTANNVWVLGAKGRLTNPESHFHISLDGWSKVYAGSAKMVDRDFLDPNNPSLQTDISVHDHTKLNTALALDLECGNELLFSKKKNSCWSLGYLLGIKYSKFEWEAFGGKYNYNNGTHVGELPSGLKGITYTLNYLIPYVGLQGSWRYNDCWNFSAFGKYTRLGFVITKDRHWLRSITFTDTFRYTRYWILGAEATWNYTECVALNLKYSFDWLERSTGHTHVHDSGDYFGFSKSAGIESTYHMLTLGLAVQF